MPKWAKEVMSLPRSPVMRDIIGDIFSLYLLGIIILGENVENFLDIYL